MLKLLGGGLQKMMRVYAERQIYAAMQSSMEPLNSELHKHQSLQAGTFFEGWVLDGQPVVHPEKLAREKGVEIYRKMMRRDDMISSGSTYVSLAAIAPGWEITAADPAQPKDVEAKEWQEYNFANIKGTVNQMLINILDGL